jgi:uncharacterized protein YbjT (DUF2867 family)
VIFVTTAGKVGSAAARLIAQRDVPVRVLVRHPEKVAPLAQAGVEIFPGDLDSPESIDQAMRGASRVILVTQPVLSQELSVIDSAERAGIEHVVKITNKADAHSPIARRRIQSEIEDALVASGLSYTLLRNNAYMQNFLMMAAGIAQTSSFRTATGDGRIGHVDVRDVAAGAAEIAVSPAGHAGKTYWPTGPESLSGNDVAESFTKVLGRLITFHPISYEEQKQAMIDVGLPEPVAKDNALAVAWMADGDCDYVTDDLPQILGRPAHSSGSPSTTPRRSHEGTAATAPTPLGVVPAVATSRAFAPREKQPAERPPDDHQHGSDGSDRAPARAHDEG